MSNLIDIARGGILTYRTALAVTGENITNVNTEGYHRRDVTQAEIAGAQGTLLSGPSMGSGVRVEEVRRAFDGLLADRVRNAAGDMQSVATHLAKAAGIENILLPDSGGIDDAMDGFFAAVGGLVTDPTDTALRRVVLTGGTALAGAISGAASSLTRLSGDVQTEATLAAETATGLLQRLKEVNDRLGQMPRDSQGAKNPLEDTRDRLMSELGDILPVTVQTDARGRSKITLGAQPGGAVLLDGAGAARISATGADRLTLTATRGGTTLGETRMNTGGTLGGLSAALGSISAAVQELDALARRIASDLNAAHADGLDLRGNRGGELFSTEGWTVTPATVNTGSTLVTIEGRWSADPRPELTLVRDGAAGLWELRDGAGAVLGTGNSQIDAGGLVIGLTGAAMDGDRITLGPTTGRAVDMQFVLTDTAGIAAASAQTTQAAAGNAGTGMANMIPVAQPALGSPVIAALLGSTGTDAADAASFLGPGVVGHIPAGTQGATLASLGRQALAEIALTAAEAGGATDLSITLDGVTHSFALATTGGVDGLAGALNDGSILSATGQSFADLGLQAGAGAAGLSIARSRGDIDAAALDVAGAPRTANLTGAAAAGGQVQVFTRDGRQIAGSPLSAAEAAALLTTANGFNAGAVYDPSPLNAAGGTGYRGAGVTRAAVPGDQALTLAPATGLRLHDSTGATAAAVPARSLTLSQAGSLPVTLSLPEGTSAAAAADAMRQALPGLAATATTALQITAPADGTLGFRLSGSGVAPVDISGAVVGGRMDGIALAVNATTASTGIRAELSPDGSRLLLVQDQGHDIGITALSHSGGQAVTLRQTDARGGAIGTPAVSLGGGGPDSLRATGQVALQSAASFAVAEGGGALASAVDPAAGGLVALTSAKAGAERSLSFGFDPALDGAGQSVDGTALAGATEYSVTLNGTTVTLNPGAAGITDAAGVAAGLAGLLRAEAPSVTMTGNALTQLPADGTAMALTVDGQSYTLRMVGGAVAVEGPEAGRLTAAFDGANRLTVSLSPGATDGRTPVMGGQAAAFGLTTSRLTGAPIDAGDLPATVTLRIAGTDHAIGLTDAGGGTVNLSVPPGFPGTATIDATTGGLSIALPAGLDSRILPPGMAGFAAFGAAVTVTGDRLTATTLNGNPVNLTGRADGLAAQRLTLDDLPPEDLIVAMTGAGSGAMRLAGSAGPVVPAAASAAVTLEVTDAAARSIRLVDPATGDVIATGTLDAAGQATIGGHAITISGNPASGDSYRLIPAQTGSGNGDNADRLAQLRTRDTATGRGGFAEILTSLQGGVGTKVAALTDRDVAVRAAHESATRAEAELSAVDLDAEAARLIEFQQAYQASAQIMSVARELFDTLINAL